jgi:hypothetical protein
VAPKIAEGRALVYSYENLATPPGIDRTAAAQRVAQLFPAGGTILVIRNQFTLLESLFSHLLVTGKIFGTFEQWLRSHLANPHNTFIAHARFFEIYELYCRLFGRDRVLVLLFEELGADKPAFARQISDFLAIDATETEALLTNTDKRKSRPSRWNALIHQNPALAAVDRAVRPLVPAQARHRMKRLFDHRLQATTDWPPEMRQQLADYFSPGNRQLADLGLPLEDHGYPL